MDFDDRPSTPSRRRAEAAVAVPRATLFRGSPVRVTGEALMTRIDEQLRRIVEELKDETLQLSLYGINGLSAGDVLDRVLKEFADYRLLFEYIGLHRIEDKYAGSKDHWFTYMKRRLVFFEALRHLHLASVPGLAALLFDREEDDDTYITKWRELVSLFVFDDPRMKPTLWNNLRQYEETLKSLSLIACDGFHPEARTSNVVFEDGVWEIVTKKKKLKKTKNKDGEQEYEYETAIILLDSDNAVQYIQRFSPFRGVLRSLIALDISGGLPLSKKNARWLMCELAFNRRIERLTLRRVGLGPQHIRMLAEIVLLSDTLSYVDVRENTFDFASFSELLDAAESNARTYPVLRVLSPADRGEMPYPLNTLTFPAPAEDAMDEEGESVLEKLTGKLEALQVATPVQESLAESVLESAMSAKRFARKKKDEDDDEPSAPRGGFFIPTDDAGRPTVTQLAELERTRRSGMAELGLLDLPARTLETPAKKLRRRAKKLDVPKIKVTEPAAAPVVVMPEVEEETDEDETQPAPPIATDSPMPPAVVFSTEPADSARLHPSPPVPIVRRPLLFEGAAVANIEPELIGDVLVLSFGSSSSASEEPSAERAPEQTSAGDRAPEQPSAETSGLEVVLGESDREGDASSDAGDLLDEIDRAAGDDVIEVED